MLRGTLLSLCLPAVLAAQSTVHVTATNYSFDAPDTIAAGVVTFQLVSKGPELHHLQIVRFEDGKTFADLAAALKNPGPPPTWVTFIGGPNAGVPDGSAATTDAVTLTPGNYAFLCLIPGPDMQPHVMKGMARPFVVKAGSPVAQAGATHVDATLSLFDYNFDLDKPLTAGHRTILVKNNAAQWHEALLVKLLPGVKLDSLPAWIMGGMKGMPPAIPLGGVTAVGPGSQNVITVDLAPGDYALYCFLPDMKDGKEHVTHGMLKQITVQ